MRKIENISEIINNAVNEGKSREEINAMLKEAGSSLMLTEGKMGNALLDIGVGSPEFVVVKDGKLTNGAGGVPHQDYVYYAGKTYQLADDGVTLVEVPATDSETTDGNG